MKHVIYFLIVIFALSFQSCAIVSPGQVGVVQKLGKLGSKVHDPGPVWYNPFISKVLRANVQTSNLELSMSLPSKEGLSVNSQISILYAIKKNKVPTLIEELSLDYEPIIANVFRSAASDVCSKYFAKDMHSGMRANIETAIKERMTEILTKDGLIIEAVLMKSIQLPPGLAQSIEQKLQAEQDAMRMEFVLQEARAEADRRIIEAQGISDSQKILSEGLSEEILKVRSIEAFEKLSRSPNAKVIITDGKAPFLINE